VFKWSDKGPYEYSIEFLNEYQQWIFFNKSRGYIGKEDVEILGQKFDAIKFKGIYSFGLVGKEVECEYYQYSYYVREIGMVKYEKNFPDRKGSILDLTKIYSEDEWNEMIQ
jgi:hypothetical protein